MKRPLYISLLVTGLVLIAGYVGFVFLYFHKTEPQQVCQSIGFDFVSSANAPFVQTATLTQLLKEQNLYPVGQDLNQVSTDRIEQAIERNPLIKKAECYKMVSGQVKVRVRQREPFLRVATASENYFIDQDREYMPAWSHVSAYVPVLTGHVSKPLASHELFDFVQFIEQDDFWSAQIEQINVVSLNQIELVPRVGSHLILLGDLNRYEQKLRKLEIFYKQGLSKIGWQEYREIDLRYRGQVICRK